MEGRWILPGYAQMMTTEAHIFDRHCHGKVKHSLNCYIVKVQSCHVDKIKMEPNWVSGDFLS